MGSKIVSLPHTSSCLAGNPTDDPIDREVLVYLPDGYEDDSSRHYPTIYVLAAYLGDARGLLSERRFSPGLHTRLDRLIRDGLMPPAIFVLPDCFTRYGGSQYLNSSATGAYQDYLLDEVIPFVDSELRTLPDPLSRGVLGKSSGGYGALGLAMRKPGIFGGVASISGDAYFEYCYLPEFPVACGLIRPHGSVEAFLEYWSGLPEREGKEIAALNIIAMASCYSPDPASPGRFLLPFDMETGELLPEIWHRWLEHDPVRLLPASVQGLKALRWLHLECGDRDEYNLHYGAQILSARMNELGISHSFELFSGGHRGLNYRFESVIPKMVEALVK